MRAIISRKGSCSPPPMNLRVYRLCSNLAKQFHTPGSWGMMPEKPFRGYNQVRCQTRPAVPALDPVTRADCHADAQNSGGSAYSNNKLT